MPARWNAFTMSRNSSRTESAFFCELYAWYVAKNETGA